MPALETAQKCDSTGHFVLILACFLPLPSDFDKGPAGEGGGDVESVRGGTRKYKKEANKNYNLKENTVGDVRKVTKERCRCFEIIHVSYQTLFFYIKWKI